MHRHAPPFKLAALVCMLLSATNTAWAQEGLKADGDAMQLKTSPQLRTEAVKADEQSPLFLRADQVSGVLDNVVTAEGHAELRKRGLSVKADVLSYQSVSDLAEAKGNVRLFREGNLYTGPELKLTTETGEGVFLLPTYRLAKTGGGGTASRINFLDKRRSVAFDTTYSTCPRNDLAWELTAGEVRFDFEEEEGVGTDVKLTFKGVPLIVAPKLSFPLTDKRRSGFLPPQAVLSTSSGFEITQPYYWDIAPNRDYTFSPTLISKRGVQLGNEFRYLEPSFNGELRADWMPSDAQQQQDQRWAGSLRHAGTAWGALSYSVNAARVSDDNYWKDFPGGITGLTQRQLPADFNASYAVPYGSLSSRFVRYQTLQNLLNPADVVGEPYDVEPQLTGRWQRLNWRGVDATLDTQWSRFKHNTLIDGERSVLAASLSYPIQAPGYFAIPKVGFRQVNYRLNTPMTDGRTSASVAIPTFSLDSGLVFERNARFFGQQFTQTLEPRAFYLRTPYRDQAALPNFDTGPLDFSFPAIYSDNAFSGYDRVSDDHTLTVGVSSRLLDESTGAERLRLQYAQRVRFADQRVTASNVPNTERLSDALFGVTFIPNDKVSFDTTVQYNPDAKNSVRSTIGARYTPAPFKTLALAYRLKRDSPGVVPRDGLEQYDVAWQWPLAFAALPRVYTVGRVIYSRKDQRITDSIAGFEWERDCWLFRLVAQRNSTDLTRSTTRFYLQLELTGLTRLGTNPLSTLMSNIPQYRVLGQPSERPNPYTNYE